MRRISVIILVLLMVSCSSDSERTPQRAATPQPDDRFESRSYIQQSQNQKDLEKEEFLVNIYNANDYLGKLEKGAQVTVKHQHTIEVVQVNEEQETKKKNCKIENTLQIVNLGQKNLEPVFYLYYQVVNSQFRPNCFFDISVISDLKEELLSTKQVIKIDLRSDIGEDFKNHMTSEFDLEIFSPNVTRLPLFFIQNEIKSIIGKFNLSCLLGGPCYNNSLWAVRASNKLEFSKDENYRRGTMNEKMFVEESGRSVLKKGSQYLKTEQRLLLNFSDFSVLDWLDKSIYHTIYKNGTKESLLEIDEVLVSERSKLSEEETDKIPVEGLDYSEEIEDMRTPQTSPQGFD